MREGGREEEREGRKEGGGWRERMAHRQFIGVPYLQLLVSRAGGEDTSVMRIPLDHADRTSSPIIIAPAEHTHSIHAYKTHTH